MDETPQFSAVTRTRVYVTGLIVSAASFVTAGAAVALDADPAIAVIAGLVGSAFGTVAAGLGVGYRPTRG